MKDKSMMKHAYLRCALGAAGAVVLLMAQAAHAREWMDVITSPFADPLFTRPPELEAGKILPGDTHAHFCDGSNDLPTRPLTLSDAIDMALCRNPEVQSAWAGIKERAAQVGEARAAYLPKLNAGFGQQTQKTQYPESNFQVDTDRTNKSRYVNLTWRLLDFGGREANRRSANARLEAALASHDAALQKTMATVIGLYFEAQTARANREAKEKNEALAMQTLDTTKKRAARGAAAQTDTLQAETSLAKAELEHARAIGTDEKSLVALTLALGLQAPGMDAQTLSLAADYQDQEMTLRQDLSDWLRLAQEQHPAVAAARAEWEAAKEQLTATRSEGLPTLDFTQGKYVNGRPNQSLSTTQTTESVLGFSLTIPLFDGFGKTYKVRGAQAQIEIREADFRNIRNQVLGEVAKAHAEALAALRNLQSSRRLLDAAQSAVEIVQLKYELGVSDILEMLNVQAALADAGQERIRALSEWRSARLRLLANAGSLGGKDVGIGKPSESGSPSRN